MSIRIGVLECDHVADRHRSIAGDYVDMFRAMLAGPLPEAKIVPYDACYGVLPESPTECDAWLCTGSRASAFDEAGWITDLAAFVGRVRDAERPYVGVCFGHQLLVHALGGRVERVGWGVGVHRLEVAAVEAGMGFESADLLYMHQDQVTRLPAEGVVLGSTDHCRMAAVRVASRMVGVQAHPEFTARYVGALIEERVEPIGLDRAEAARRTLADPIDEGVVAAWIGRVLRGPG